MDKGKKLDTILEKVHKEYHDPVIHLPTIDETEYIMPATQEQEFDRLTGLHDFRVAEARENFGAFMEFVFIDQSTGTPLVQQWFHDQWGNLMENSNRCIICAPRDHGKTSQVIGYVLWVLGRDPNLRIKIACASDSRAKERLFEVVQNIMYNRRFQEVFPNCRPAENAEWSKHKIIVNRTAMHRDASVEATGITSTVTGGRCDLLIADDVVDRRNALSFPALREQIKQAWLSDWTNLLEADSRVIDICTLWHKDDLNHMLMDNPAYKVLFYGIDSEFGSIWPSKWPEEALRLRHREIGTVEFNRAFRNQAVDEESAIVRGHWIKYKNLRNEDAFTTRLEHLIFLTSYDTAGSPTGNKKQDFTANCVLAVDPELRRVYVVDAKHGRKTVKAQAKQIYDEALRYDPFRILIEKVGQATVDEWAINDYPQLADRIEVTKPTVSKTIRLLGITPLMENGQVIFSDTLNPERVQWEPGAGSLVDELLDFPFGKHDDMVDAFSQAMHAARRYFLDYGADQDDNELDIRIGANSKTDGYLY